MKHYFVVFSFVKDGFPCVGNVVLDVDDGEMNFRNASHSISRMIGTLSVIQSWREVTPEFRQQVKDWNSDCIQMQTAQAIQQGSGLKAVPTEGEKNGHEVTE